MRDPIEKAAKVIEEIIDGRWIKAASSKKLSESKWYPLAPKFIWRCCRCGHSCKMEWRIRKGSVEIRGKSEN
jgi:rubrerythrin